MTTSEPTAPLRPGPLAGGVKLESLLKLNDVKVTVAASSVGLGLLPRRRSSDEQEPPPVMANGAAPAQRSGEGQQAAAGKDAGAAQEPAQLPPVKTLLEFVVWVVLQEEAAAAAAAAVANGKRGSAVSSAGSDYVARCIKSGYLAHQLPDLALAVRRMQTGRLAGRLAGRKERLMQET